jgi:hypothetical protein
MIVSLTKYLVRGNRFGHEVILNAVDYSTGELTSVSTCNLTEVGLQRFVRNDGSLDKKELEISLRLITRIGIYQTCVDMKNQVFDKTQKEERLLGVSVNGWMDAFNLMGMDPISEEADRLKRWMRDIANDEADRFSKKLGINRPLLVTLEKPAGTTSQVLGCSSGIHWQWSPFYIRRVRITTRDPLAQTLLDMGYPAYPEVYDLANWKEAYGKGEEEWQGMDSWQKIEVFKGLSPIKKRFIIDSCNTTVFEFPVSAPKGCTIGEVDVITQLKSLLSFSTNYADHMPSCTISVKAGEWESIPDWIIDKWDKGFVTASFLSYDDSNYPLLPYEAIDAGEFNKRIKELGNKVVRTEQAYYLDVDLEILNRYEATLDTTEIIEEACVGSSSCPLR